MSHNLGKCADAHILGFQLQNKNVDVAAVQEHHWYYHVDKNQYEAGDKAACAVDTLKTYGYYTLHTAHTAFIIRRDVWPSFSKHRFSQSSCGRSAHITSHEGLRLINCYAHCVGNREDRSKRGAPGAALADWVRPAIGRGSLTVAHPKTLLLGDLQNTMTDTRLDNRGVPEAATPHSLLRVALDMGMISTFRSMHPEVSAITRQSLHGGQRGGRLIDHILKSEDLQTLHAAIDTDDTPRFIHSDHYAVHATIRTTAIRTPNGCGPPGPSAAGIRWGALASAPTCKDTGRCFREGPEYWCMKAKDSRLVRGFQRSMHAPSATKRVPVMRKALLAMQQQAAAASAAGNLAPRSCEARATISKIMHQLLTITEHAAPSEMHSDATGAPCVTAVVTEARKGSPGQVMTAPVTGPTRSFRQLEQRIKQASTKLAYVARRAGPGMDANAEQHVRDVWVEVCQILPTIVDGINKAQAEAHTTYQQWTQDQAAARAAKVPADKRALVAQHDRGLLAIRQEMQEEVEAGSARVAPAHVRKLAHVAIPSANQHSTDGDWRQFRMELAQRAPDTLAWLRAQRDRMNSKCNEISHKHQTHMLRMNDMQGVVQATRASSKPSAPPPARYTRLVGGNPANSSEQYVECTRKATGASMQTQGTPLPFAKRQTVAGVTTYDDDDVMY